MKRLIGMLLVAALFPAANAVAEDPVVTQAWARATPPGSAVAAVYLTIDNGGRPADRLLSVTSTAAERAEVHTIVHDGDVVRMRRVEALDIGAGERVVFEPGGLHVMLMGLKSPLVQGERIAVTLGFEQAGPVRTEADILAGDATDPHAGHRH